MERIVQTVKGLVPSSAKSIIRRGTRTLTTRLGRYAGVLPDFLIIGAQRCGTTSLYNYLIQHTCVYPAIAKEVGYFDRYYSPDVRWYRAHFPTIFRHNDVRWYRAHFPSIFRQYYVTHLARRSFITGEASTGYILNPHALRRISGLVPHAKLILMLRNPVDRAYSHYHQTLKAGKEIFPFEEAIKHEHKRIGAAWERMLADETYYNLDIALYAYLRTGIYVDQLTVLTRLFPQQQVLIVKSEEFYADPPRTVKLILEFLQVPSWDLKDFTIYNGHSYAPMTATTRQRLVEYFKPHNRRLYEDVGINFDWDR